MTGLLEVRELDVSFGAGFCVGPVSFAMNHGVLYVEGPNGSGKTTLLRAMSGELSPSGGRVLVAGHDVHKSATARRLVALVPSNPELPDFLTVTEAFEFAASIRRSPAWNGAEYCAELHLDPHLRLGNASAGERRKAELICGLAGDPRVLLLDETFTHLDDDSARKLRQWVVEWSASRVILLTQHQGAPVSPDARLQVTQGRVTFTADRGRDRPGRRL